MRLYGAEVFFTQLDRPEELQRIGSLFRDFKNILYKERSILRNAQLFTSAVKKPLLNGLEFGANADINLALLHTRKGSRKETGSKTEFNLKLNNGYEILEL